MRAPKNPPQRNYSQYVYALLSRQNCIDLGQIPRERDQHRPRGNSIRAYHFVLGAIISASKFRLSMTIRAVDYRSATW